MFMSSMDWAVSKAARACEVVWSGGVGYPPRFPTQRTSLAPCAGTTGSYAEYSMLRITQQWERN